MTEKLETEFYEFWSTTILFNKERIRTPRFFFKSCNEKRSYYYKPIKSAFLPLSNIPATKFI